MKPSSIFLNDSDIFINVLVRMLHEIQSAVLSKKNYKQEFFFFLLFGCTWKKHISTIII